MLTLPAPPPLPAARGLLQLLVVEGNRALGLFAHVLLPFWSKGGVTPPRAPDAAEPVRGVSAGDEAAAICVAATKAGESATEALNGRG
jgi:hypothetical protein